MNKGRGRPRKNPEPKAADPSAVAHAWRDGVVEGVEMAIEALEQYHERGRPDELSAWANALKAWSMRGGEIPEPPGLGPIVGLKRNSR